MHFIMQDSATADHADEKLISEIAVNYLCKTGKHIAHTHTS